MNSSLKTKRKARVIQVDDDALPPNGELFTGTTTLVDPSNETPEPLFQPKNIRKPRVQSGLRRVVGADQHGSAKSGDSDRGSGSDGGDGPVVVRPNISKSKSSKRPPKTNKLSFRGETNDDETQDDGMGRPNGMPLGKQVTQNNAMKKGLGNRGLPMRSLQGDDDRPRYSKEFLEELQSSTPNSPAVLSAAQIDEDDMELDASELEGAMIVDSPLASSQVPITAIMTEVEVQERKQRRARLAKEENFLSLEDEEDDDGRKKKEETRLKKDDDDMGEGFDDFVEDGGLSLGKRATKVRRRQERQQMAEMINQAEGNSSDASSDSDAERRIAYEAAQTRAGMDGLKKPQKDATEELLQVPPKITPLPNLPECLAQLQSKVREMQLAIKEKQAAVQQLQDDREEVTKRETEVQALLDDAGKKYQEVLGSKSMGSDISGPDGNVPLSLDISERGLDSIGTTPLREAPNGDIP